MTRLFVFGDSYSTPGFCVEPRDSFWGLAARDLQATEVLNYSWCGNNLDSITHVIVNMINKFQADDRLLIGVPPLERVTYYSSEDKEYYCEHFFDNMSISRKELVPCHGNLTQVSVHQFGRDTVEHWNRGWAEAQALRTLITLATTLKHCSVEHIIVNLAEPFMGYTDWPVLQGLQYQADEWDIHVFRNTYYSVNKDINKPVDFDTHGWHGHHDAVGNGTWYYGLIKSWMQVAGWL